MKSFLYEITEFSSEESVYTDIDKVRLRLVNTSY